ncbi:MAG: hypothetical protein GAK45_00112 [Pseudomonas citronellolis]|nr:MAG: hypothetical protein GAK45_00112 [Pseudomonas citronellolis]
MPDQPITFAPEQLDVLERVREQQGLDNVQQVVEWLAKQALRKQADRAPGGRRALVIVQGEKK